MVKFIKYTDPLGFQVWEYQRTMEDGTVFRELSTVVGSGTVFYIPDGITSVGVFSKEENLKKIFIPASVKTIGFGTFWQYDDSLDIYCEAPEKPEGFAEGEFYDYVFFGRNIWYGNWLTDGTLGDAAGRKWMRGLACPGSTGEPGRRTWPETDCSHL